MLYLFKYRQPNDKAPLHSFLKRYLQSTNHPCLLDDLIQGHTTDPSLDVDAAWTVREISYDDVRELRVAFLRPKISHAFESLLDEIKAY